MGFVWMCVASLSGWIADFPVAVAVSLNQPPLPVTVAQLSQKTANQDTEERLNADFSKMSERYRREIQRGQGSDEDSRPESSQNERKRQALEDLADTNRPVPAAQQRSQRRPNRRFPQFQLQLDPLE
ncbi:MAG: hypothetical protein ETSY1_07745 [Candidatus Entotheonella factor]|uniref:Uncharacterized protein n=1 Tax=Entotheonella factor TaxID=1429438 RepID=W4LUH0_ENTF1|nr:MAG: hypothetical protein ETSY1_07745 [Candidatus Entotheonella factor]